MPRQEGILILGPTGSGKTPLGELLEKTGLGGWRCCHFDFGARFRSAASCDFPPAPLADADIAVIRESMKTGELLTDEQFPVAAKILAAFLQEKNADENCMVILNGMPRHSGQAAGIEGVLRVCSVVELSCEPAVVLERIRRDTGGDRAGRKDDLPALVIRKLEIYRQQTRPLLKYYSERGVPVLTVPVTVISTASDIAEIIRTRIVEITGKQGRSDEDSH